MRLFELHRTVDPVGVSGTGIVAQGVEFDNGRCAVTFLNGKYKTVTPHDSIDSVLHIHCHEGTNLVWLDGSEYIDLVTSDQKKQILNLLASYQAFEAIGNNIRNANILFSLRCFLQDFWRLKIK